MNDRPTQSMASAGLRLEQRGGAGALFPIVLVNSLLNIITLLIYRFWGKTKVRRYLWRETYFLGEPLEYTGTGGELINGFIAVFFLVLLPLGILSNLANLYLEPESPAYITFNGFFYALVLFLIGMAIYRARRYRLSRTVWRGIRGGMNGSAPQYAVRYVCFLSLAVVTLGWAYPWMRRNLFLRIMNETTFGDRAFRCTASLGPLYKAFAPAWFAFAAVPLAIAATITATGAAAAAFETGNIAPHALVLIIVLIAVLPFVLILALAYYKALEFQHWARHTSFMGLTFHMRATFGSLLRVGVANFFILVLTLGFGRPFTQLIIFRYVCARLDMLGDLDPTWIAQSSAKAPSIGEGLADAFDLGAV